MRWHVTTQVHAHYFEDGNVQLQTTKTIPSHSFPFSSEGEFADQIVAHINVSMVECMDG